MGKTACGVPARYLTIYHLPYLSPGSGWGRARNVRASDIGPRWPRIAKNCATYLRTTQHDLHDASNRLKGRPHTDPSGHEVSKDVPKKPNPFQHQRGPRDFRFLRFRFQWVSEACTWPKKTPRGSKNAPRRLQERPRCDSSGSRGSNI
eukprot:306891-Pyramimonas_sp.AAC.1